MEKTEAVIISLFSGVENRLHERRWHCHASAILLGPKNSNDFRIGYHRFAPANALNLRTDLERRNVEWTQLRISYCVLTEFRPAVLKFALAPTNDLIRAV